jgi:hypothetical protein
MKMKKATFVIEKSILLTALKAMKKITGRESKKNKQIMIEFTITDNKLKLVIPGNIVFLDCITTSTVKAFVPFYYFYDIIESEKKDSICVTITNEIMQINNLTINAPTTFFDDDSILRSIKLPVNYTDAFLLKLEHQGYTNEELLFNRMEYKIEMAKRRKLSNLNNALNFLETYGIKFTDLEKIVNEKLSI